MAITGVNVNTPQQVTNQTQANATENTTATQQTEENLFVNETAATNETGNVATVEEVEAEIGELKSIGEKLGLDLTGDLEKDFDALNEYPGKLDAMLEKIEKLIEEKLQELKDLEGEQAALLQDETTIKARIEQLTNKQKLNEEQQKELAQQIETTKANNEMAQVDFQVQYSTKLAEAEASYNPEKHGEDKQKYINEQMEGFGKAQTTDLTSMQSELGSLQSEGTELAMLLNTTNTTLTNVQNKLQTVDVKITAVKSEIEVANKDKAAVEAEIKTIPAKAKEVIKNSVDPAEWAIIEQSNVNFSETLEDGTPRYMLAKGKEDNKFHIYDMGAGGASIVRQNAPGKGFDIIKRGNGYLGSYKSAADGTEGANKTFKFTLSDTSFSSTKESATYKTYSPLAFDLNGGGFQTSNETIDFDIDGDGQMDKINNVFEGILAFDKDGDGLVGENGSELFGNNTDLDNDGKADGYKDGFEALKALAMKENLFNGIDDLTLDASDLEVLSEKYGLIMQMGYNGETKSFGELGISQINLAATNATTLQDNFDGKDNQLMTQEGATFVQNGQEKDYADIWHVKK